MGNGQWASMVVVLLAWQMVPTCATPSPSEYKASGWVSIFRTMAKSPVA